MRSEVKDFLYRKISSNTVAATPIVVAVCGSDASGTIFLKENDVQIGCVAYGVCERNGEKSLKFEGLASISNGKGVGSKIIIELVKLSKEMGCDGRLCAQASPYRPQNDCGKGIEHKLTNMVFYYKLGFRADNVEVDKDIRSCIERGEEIPLRLNVFQNISLSKEAAKSLLDRENKLKELYNCQQAIISQQAKNKLLNKI